MLLPPPDSERKSQQKPVEQHKSKKNLQIEGLRAIGLMIILMFHFLYWRGEKFDNAQCIVPIMKEWGIVGVALFFIISGYFLFPAESANTQKFNLPNYVYSKIRKLWLPYALSVFITWMVFRMGINPNYFPSFKELFLNLLGLQYIFGSRPINGAHWYLIQLAAFIVMAMGVRLLKWKLSFVIPCYFAACMIVHLFKEQISLNCNIFAIVFGCLQNEWNFVALLLGISFKQYQHAHNKNTKLTYLTYMIVLCLSLYGFQTPNNWYTAYAASAIILFYLAFINCTAHHLKFLQWAPLTYLGSISFYVYLIHTRIGYFIINHLQIHIGIHIAILIAFVVSILLGIALRWISLKSLRIFPPISKS